MIGSDCVTSCIQALTSQTKGQEKESFHKVKSANLDEKSMKKALEKLKRVTHHVSSVKNVENKIQVVEYNDRYEIEIQTGGDIQGVVTVRHDGDGRRVKCQVSTGKTRRFSTTVVFSCPVLLEGHTVKVNNKLLQGTLYKDKTLSMGEKLLPWRRLSAKSVAELPSYPTSDFSSSILAIHTEWVYPTEGECEAVKMNKPYPRHQLRDQLRLVMTDPAISKMRVLAIPRKKPNGVTALERCQSTIVFHELKLWENKAAMFLTVYDHDVITKMIREGRLLYQTFVKELGDLNEVGELNESLLEGYVMLATILKVNAYRLQQDIGDSSWKLRSFLRPRYPFINGGGFVKKTEMLTKFTENGQWKDMSSMFEFIQMVRENMEMVPSSTRSDQDQLFKDSQRFFKPICDSCGRMSECKTCTGCNRARYCSRQCQKKAWPQHKQHCRK